MTRHSRRFPAIAPIGHAATLAACFPYPPAHMSAVLSESTTTSADERVVGIAAAALKDADLVRARRLQDRTAAAC